MELSLVFWYLWLQWEITSDSEPATYTYAAECACHWRSLAAGRRDSHAVCNFSSGRWSVWTTHNEPLKENERWRDQWGLEAWCSLSAQLYHHSTLEVGIISVAVIINESTGTTFFSDSSHLSYLLYLLTNMIFLLYLLFILSHNSSSSHSNIWVTLCMLHWTLKVKCICLNYLVDTTSSTYKELTERIH